MPTIHFFLVPVAIRFAASDIHPLLKLFLGIVHFFAIIGLFAYANAFRPWVPGKSNWKTKEYWSPLVLEKSVGGLLHLLALLMKILIFSVLLYLFIKDIFLYISNSYYQILDGTYVYDKHEAASTMALAFILFLLVLYLLAKRFNKHGDREENIT